MTQQRPLQRRQHIEQQQKTPTEFIITPTTTMTATNKAQKNTETTAAEIDLKKKNLLQKHMKIAINDIFT